MKRVARREPTWQELKDAADMFIDAAADNVHTAVHAIEEWDQRHHAQWARADLSVADFLYRAAEKKRGRGIRRHRRTELKGLK